MSSPPHEELERWRDEFPILCSRTYLNSCSLGPLSRRSLGYVGEFHALWNSMGASAWYEIWLGRLAKLRQSVARLLRAREGEIGLLPSVSAALAMVGSAVDFSRRNRVVVSELDFPTQIYSWMARPGVEVVRVPSDDGVGIAPDRWAEAVDERTALVVTSHVFYSTGYIQDLEAISRAARAAGALSVIDGYHGAGQLPVDPRAAGVDVYATGPLKWLLGGPGMAFLWVREERIPALRPTLASWFGARDQFAFDPDRFEFRDDAARFELGTPSLPTAYAALGGLEIVLEAGPERIRERIAALSRGVVEGARGAGLEVRTAREEARRSGIVMVRMPDAADAVRRLAEAGIIVDRRGDFVRVSPHFFNTPEECARVVDALDRAR